MSPRSAAVSGKDLGEAVTVDRGALGPGTGLGRRRSTRGRTAIDVGTSSRESVAYNLEARLS